MEPIIYRNFFSSDLVVALKAQTKLFKGPYGALSGVREERKVFFRKEVHSHAIFKALHFHMIDRANEIFREAVKPSYCFVAMYDDERSICPLHTDRPQCKFTIDVCLDHGEPWELFVNDQPYVLNPGDAVCYSGTDHPHYRNKIKPGNFCDLAFFHFVPENFSGGLR